MATTNPTAAKADEAATAKAKPKTPSKVLVFNDRGGIYECNSARQRTKKERPTGVGKDHPDHQFDVTTMRVPPGLHLVEAEAYQRVHKNPGFARRVKEHELVVLGGEPGEDGKAGDPWEDAWDDIRPKRKIDYIEHTADVACLREILEVEEDEGVAIAIQEQIALCTEDGKAKQAARRAQRAHNRAGANRRRIN